MKHSVKQVNGITKMVTGDEKGNLKMLSDLSIKKIVNAVIGLAALP